MRRLLACVLGTLAAACVTDVPVDASHGGEGGAGGSQCAPGGCSAETGGTRGAAAGADGATCTLADCATAACSDAPICNSPGVPTVPVTSEERRCEVDADCERTTDRCDACCELVPIAANARPAHVAALASACSDFASSSDCDCPPTAESDLCVDGQRERVAPESDCTDGEDNDFDGLVDCDDDCLSSPSCRIPRELTVPQAHQVCSTDEDCTEVSTDCADHCLYAAIATNCADAFREAYSNLCSDYSGEVSECDHPETVLRCFATQCQIIPMESSCADGFDNDDDFETDCDDPDCTASPDCAGAWELPVSPDQRVCRTDDDRTQVATDCADCCQYDAIATDCADDFRVLRDGFCVSYPGGAVCDCVPRETVLDCVDSQCEIIPK